MDHGATTGQASAVAPDSGWMALARYLIRLGGIVFACGLIGWLALSLGMAANTGPAAMVLALTVLFFVGLPAVIVLEDARKNNPKIQRALEWFCVVGTLVVIAFFIHAIATSDPSTSVPTDLG